jgi:hypothetical protein
MTDGKIEVSRDSVGQFNDLIADNCSVHISRVDDDVVFISVSSGSDEPPIGILIMAPDVLSVDVSGGIWRRAE